VIVAPLRNFAIVLLCCAGCVAGAGERVDPAAPVVDDTPAALAQRQLEAYNRRDIDAFLAVYNDDVEVYDYPGRLVYRGKEAMRARYLKRFEATNLHCDLLHRIVRGNVVIDDERVVGISAAGPIEATVIYTVAGGRIVRVEFIP